MNAPTLAELIALKDAAGAAMKRRDSYRVAGALGGYDTEIRESASASFKLQMEYAAALTAFGHQDGRRPECGHYFNCCSCHR